MHRSKRYGLLCLMAALLLLGRCAAARAQALGSGSQGSLAAELRRLNAGAAHVFVGQILTIRRKPGLVEVLFRVETPVRGENGAKFVLREWSGLWAPGHLRYAAGDRVLAFLHGEGANGLSSPVHGAEGLLPVVVQGAQAPRLVDIRRVAASIQRAPGTPLPTEETGAVDLAAVLAVVNAAGGAAPVPLSRLRLPLRGQPPAALVPPIVLQSSTDASAGVRHLPLDAPVLRGVADARR